MVGDDGAVVDEDDTVTIAVLANDTGDVDPSSVLVSAAPANGVAAVTAGQISYTPDADFFGTDELSYSVATTDGQAASGRVTVSVRSVNDLPVVPGPNDPSVDEDGVLTFEPLDGAVDVDGDTLVMSGLDAVSAAGGTLAEGSIIYTPPADFNGTDTFSYTVSDGSSETVVTVEVVVAPVPDPPRAPAGGTRVAIDEDDEAAFDLLAGWTDPDGDTLSAAAGTFATTAGGSVVVAADGTAVYTPAANYNGTDSFEYAVSDGSLQTAVTADITIAAVPDAPVPPENDIVIPGVEDATAFGDVLSGWTDPEGDAISAVPATLVTDAGGSVTIDSDGSVSYTPPADFNGEDGFDYEVEDGVDSSVAHAVIDVAPVNDDPEADDASFDVDEDTAIGTVLGVVTATDIDGDAITFTPDGETVAIDSTGTVSVVGEIDFEAASTIVLQSTADDGNGGTAAFAVTITVNDVDEAPEVDDATFTIDTEMDDGDVIGTVTAVDPEGAAVTFSIVDDTEDVEIDAASGVLTMGDEYSDDFPASITVQVTDRSGLAATATVTFDVVDATAPVIADLATSEVSIFAPTPAGLTCTDGAVIAVITATVSDEHGVIESATLSWVAAPDDDDDDDEDGDDDGDDGDDDDDDFVPILGEVPVEIVAGQLTGVFFWGEALEVDSLAVDFTLTVADDSGNTAEQTGLSITVQRCGGDDD